MSDNNNNNTIDEILSEYKNQKEQREIREVEPLEPPKRREELIDFSADNTEESSAKKTKHKKEHPKKTPEEKAELKAKRNEKTKRILKAVFSKKVMLPILAVIVIVAAGFGIKYYLDYSKTAYLKPYTEKYPDVEFPNGILEKYCNTYGSNPDAVGHIAISDIGIDMLVDKSISAPVTDGAATANYVVYLDDNKLEEHYKNAAAYNKSSKAVTYTNWLQDYNFQVLGAFYTNTDEKDDDGYIFPYNVTEKMTFESTNQYLDRIKSRLIYNVSGVEPQRSDTFLTLSCPTDYKDGYRFVVICKAVEEIDSTAQAKDKNPKDVRKTAIEYENEKDNPFRFSNHWYPEIVITNDDGTESTIQKTIDDYKKTK
ncbi:MAG: hypothetical protein K2G73_02670 [Eubacterium sp.]|nr:hypothetical protein [Eubacterium sp.]